MANDQIEVNQVVNILDGMYSQMPCDEPENRDFDRLFAANRLDKANDSEIRKFKKAIIESLQRPNDYSAQTVYLGGRMFKFYYTPSHHFEKVYLPPLKPEKMEKMTAEEIKDYNEKRDLLEKHHELYREIANLEKQLAPKRAQLKGFNEALAVMMPKSQAIHYTPVLQVG